MRYVPIIVLLLVVCLFATTPAQIPLIMDYQGVLTDAVGTAVPDGMHSMTFRLYEVDAGGTDIWTETQAVEVYKGIFNVVLGSDRPLDLPFDGQYWLGISIEGEPELSPRVPLTAVPYSLNSLGVRGWTNTFPPEANVGIGTMAPSCPLHIVADELTGLRFDGQRSASWACIVLNAAGGSSNASYEYYRENMYRGRTYLDPGNNWRLQLQGDQMLYVQSGTGLVGLGITNPLERLDIDGAVKLGTTGDSNAGTIRWTGSDFEGYNGSAWQSLTTTGAALPSGSNGQTLRHNGSDWVANSYLYNDGFNIGIGTTSPMDELHIVGGGATYANIDAAADHAPGIKFSVDGTEKWSLLYHPYEGTIQLYKYGSGAKMVIGDGGRMGVGTTTLSGEEWLEVHNPGVTPGQAAITGYSYVTPPISFGGGIGVAGIHSDDGVGGAGVYGEATDGGGMFDSQVGVYGYTDDGYGVFSNGTLGSTGPVVSVAATRDYGHRKVYAVQSTGNWFEDFGEGHLVDGEAVVEIDPVFAQTVSLNDQYHVFLTPLGDGGLYVSEKTDRHFVVRARDGGRDDIAFDYRIIAKRSGFESKRLEPARDPAEMHQRMRTPRADIRKTSP